MEDEEEEEETGAADTRIRKIRFSVRLAVAREHTSSYKLSSYSGIAAARDRRCGAGVGDPKMLLGGCCECLAAGNSHSSQKKKGRLKEEEEEGENDEAKLKASSQEEKHGGREKKVGPESHLFGKLHTICFFCVCV